MELYSIEIREFKNIFFTSVAMVTLFIAGSWLWVNNGVVRLSFFGFLRSYSSPILIGMMILSIIYSSYRRKKLTALQSIDDFQIKVREYARLYSLHTGWFVLACFVSCLLYVVTSRNFFFYFSLFQLLITLSAYPSKTMFKKELKTEDIVIY